MSKVLVYKVITANSEFELEEEVKSRLKAGFEPLGGISIAITEHEIVYSQAMVVYHHEEINITQEVPLFS